MFKTVATIRMLILVLAIGQSSMVMATAITVNISAPGPYCVGNAMMVTYDGTGNTFSATNNFIVELSDALGSFGSPLIIGNVNNSSAATGSINITFPADVSAGTGYKIRVVSSDVSVIGDPSGALTLNPQTAASVTIAVGGGNVLCNTTSATFTATPEGEGTSPAYAWKKNGLAAGTNSAIYNATGLANGDVIYVVMTSNAACPLPASPVSNAIAMTVLPIVAPTVSISGPPQVCNGVSTEFIANPTNGGTTPSFQWKKNGSNVGTNSNLYTDATLIDGDVLTCVLTSNRPCLSTPTATSNSLNITITPVVVPTIVITANPATTIGEGTTVYISSAVTNAGSSPAYQWKNNGVVIGSQNALVASNFNDGDAITCALTSNAVCAQPASAISNTITINVDDKLTRGGHAWETRASQPDGFGNAYIRSNASGFSIGNKAYIGVGSMIVSSVLTYRKDFWEYDPATGAWTQKADFGGVGRYNATGFSIGNKGFIGTGLASTGVTKDMWQYDPTTNTWIQRADYPGIAREQAFGFGIGTKGYLGGGYSNAQGDFKDFYEYDPSLNSWLVRSDFGGGVRLGTANFVIDVKGYVSSGYSSSLDTYYKDLWEFDPSVNVWTKKADLPGPPRTRATGFAVGNTGYVGLGYSNIGYQGQMWQYLPASNTWVGKPNYTGPTSLSFGTGVNVGNRGFIYKNGIWTEYNLFTIGSFASKICTTENVALTYDASSFTFGINNVFTAQISVSPAFSVITNLGTVASTASTGTLNATIPPSANGIYYFRVVSSNPVISTFPEMITVTPVPSSHTISSDAGANICKDVYTIFRSNLTGTGFQWYKNNNPVGTDAVSYLDASLVNGDIIKSTRTYIAGCKAPVGVVSNGITMTVKEAVKPVVTLNQNLLQSTTAITYQWYIDGVAISGATSSTHKMTKSGMYKVRITDSSGCFNTSDEVTGVFVGLSDESDEELVSVYPNPVSDEMSLHVADNLIVRGCSFSVINELGQIVVMNQKAGRINKINLGGRSSGLYLIRLSMDGESIVKRILKY